MALVCHLWKGSSVPVGALGVIPGPSRPVRQEASVSGSDGLCGGRKSLAQVRVPIHVGFGAALTGSLVMGTRVHAAPTASSLEAGDALAAIQRLRGRCCSKTRTSVRAEGQGPKGGSKGASPEARECRFRRVLVKTSRLQRLVRDALPRSAGSASARQVRARVAAARQPITVTGGRL